MRRTLTIVAVTLGLSVGVITLDWSLMKEPQEECWFLSDKAEAVLTEDLAKWAAHMAHADDATMEDYYSVRVPEMLELWSTSGITETEARECLQSLEKSNEMS